jgi:thiol:disulfide interchange protein DsbD
VYISQTHDVVLGGLALFAMALGMSVPLLLVGISAGSLLPRAGAWMERVKQLFGMMLLGVAIWMVSSIIPVAVHMLLWALWLLGAATLAGSFGGHHAKPPPLFARAAATAMAACALLLLVGAASGGHSVLQPLAHLKASPGDSNRTGKAIFGDASLKFDRIASVQALESALTQAQAKGESVMLDFYADWCVACKEFESFTFSNAKVQERLKPVRLLQADVTANNGEDKALMKRFGLFGPPGIVFFDGAKAAQITHKVIGYQNASDFMASLDKALPGSYQ